MDVILWGVAKILQARGTLAAGLQVSQCRRLCRVAQAVLWTECSGSNGVKRRLAETSQRQGIPLRGYGRILSVTVVERREAIKERNGSKKYFGAESIGLVSNWLWELKEEEIKTHFQDLEFRRMMTLLAKMGVTEGKRVCTCVSVLCVLVEWDAGTDKGRMIPQQRGNKWWWEV